jgi:fucose 4-O-acetylase-like acetyltransferase
MPAAARSVALLKRGRGASGATARATASRTNYAWLDVLKGIAIVAVVVDHAFIVDDYLLWKQLYFHVSWFILLAGVTNTLSAGRGGFSIVRGTPAMLLRRLQTIFWPYLWASTLAYLVLHFRHLSLMEFARELVLFRALPPFYFIALLFQLLLLFPLLYLLLHRAGWYGKIAALPLVVVLATVVSRRVTFPWTLGAHYLFGASFLYFFAIGVLLAPALVASRLNAVACIALALPVFALAEWMVIQSNGDVMTHPPSNVSLIYSLSLIVPCFALAVRFASAAPVRLIETIGHRSLAIFLYHYLFLIPILPYRHQAWTGAIGLVPGQVVLMAVAVPVAIGGSMAIAAVSARLWRWCLFCLRMLGGQDPVPGGRWSVETPGWEPGGLVSAPATVARRVAVRARRQPMG